MLASTMLWPSWCCRPSPASVVRPAVPPIRKPLPRESAKAQIGIAHALEAEHRIVDEERNHLHAVVRVGRAGGRERRHRAGLGDAFFQNLAVLRFLVVQEHLGVVRLVELALAGVDAELAEQRFHAERARFVGDDRHDALADLGMLQQHASARGRTPWCWKPRGPPSLPAIPSRTRAAAPRCCWRGTCRLGM